MIVKGKTTILLQNKNFSKICATCQSCIVLHCLMASFTTTVSGHEGGRACKKTATKYVDPASIENSTLVKNCCHNIG